MDKAREYTDKELAKLEKELTRVYSRALKEVREKWTNFSSDIVWEEKPYLNRIREAERSGDRQEIEAAYAAHKRFLQEVTFHNEKFRQLEADISGYLANIDSTAYNLANGILPDIYVTNYNSIDIPLGYAFNIIDPTTVKNLIFNRYNLLKGEVWTKQRLSSEILQGILQGESIPKISDRLKDFVGGNEAAAIRAARTAVTYAENQGRLDSMKAALKECGLVYEKQWIATHDSRTRKSHAKLDGKMATLHEPFDNGLMCPGDPDGEPEELYNCRCTMNRVLKGIIRPDGTFAEWKGKTYNDV